MERIRALFLGSPEFAVPSLESLSAYSEIDVPLVVTQPDRPAGRGRKLVAPAVKTAAEALGIPVYQPGSLRDDAALDRLRSERADVIVVVSYGELLRRSVLEMTPHGCLNVHPSLLPEYRGAVPIPAAILNGDHRTGVSIMKLVRRMDAGPLIHQVGHDLSGNETTGQLTHTMALLAAAHLPPVVKEWVNGTAEAVEQDDQQATYTRELRKSDAQIDWTHESIAIDRFIRAMDPWPRAWTLLDGERVAVLRAAVGPGNDISPRVPGELINVNGNVCVVTGNGVLELIDVQPAGRKPMAAADWFRGVSGSDQRRFRSPETAMPPIVFRR
jgi:methionyl-tRNA formyltransferase